MVNPLPDNAVTTAGTPVTINVLANDIGSNLVVTSFSNPSNGSLVFNGDKSFTYTPAAGFLGNDTFSYTVRDAQGTPATAEVTISIMADDEVTVATDDFVEVVAGGGIVVPILANDRAADGATLQVIAVSVPGHGVVNVLSDQSIRYVPQTGFVGIDSFTYTVIDEQGVTASATVTVKVVAENSAPIAVDDAFTVVADATTVLAVLTNDSDPNDGPLEVVGFTMANHGSLVFDTTNKTFSYTPQTGYTGPDQFTYTIRDNRGASAVAAVTLSVAEATDDPVAADDQVTTEAGQPITIEVLANDSLPADQEVGIVAVTLPFKGRLDFNVDKTITYTPNAGFVGTDDFTYTIGNGQGGTAKATVTIVVTASTTVDTYANGYRYRRRIVLPAPNADQATITDSVVLFNETADWLRTAANGGKVVSPDGADLRFELTDGTKLDHDIERYDPQTGELLAWVRLPSWTLAGPIQVIVYYGNASPVDDATDSVGVWQGYLARWRLPSGSDATAAGRDLVADNVTAGTLLGDAAGFDGTGKLTLTDTSWLDGLSALTVQALVKPDAAMLGGSGNILTRKSATAEIGIGLGYLAENDGVANVVYATVGSDAGDADVVSGAARQTIERQLIHARWQSGDAPQLYLNGKRATASSSQPRSGQTKSVDGPLEIGGDWVGLIDEIRITDRVLPAAWLAAEAHNMLKPGLSYGVGQEETVDSSTLPIVAVPFAVAGRTGEWIDVDVLAQSFVPAAGSAATIVGVGQPAHGSVTVIDDTVRYAPASDFIGEDQFTYTIGNGETQSSGLIVVSVVDPADQGALPAGENLLVNSKLAGDATTAGNWSNRHPGEGTIVFSAPDADDHRKVRFVATGTGNRAAIEQIYQVTAGKRYVFSVDVAAVDAATDPSRVIINHAPFSTGNVLGGAQARPTVGTVSAGQRVSYIFDATATGQLKMVLGLDGAGDVTLERPMLDESDALRAYVPTSLDVPEEPDEPDEPDPEPIPQGSLAAFGAVSAPVEVGLPFQGRYVGSALPVTTNMSSRIRNGSYGHRIIAPYDGELQHVQFNITSNRANETSKSMKGGSKSHGFPVSWDLGFRVQAANDNWEPTGSVLRDIQFTHARSSASDGRSRRLHQLDLGGLSVAAGQRLLMWTYSRESNPSDNHPSVNYYRNEGLMSPGLNPPRTRDLLYGDTPIHAITEGNKDGQGMSVYTGRGDIGGIGLRYTNGRLWGDMGFDGGTNTNVFRFHLGGGTRVRQKLRLPNRYFRAHEVWLGVYRRSPTPQAGLNVEIKGSDISTIAFTIPVGDIQFFDGSQDGQYQMQRFPLPSPFIGSPGTTYTVELSSPGTSGDGRLRIHARRRWSEATEPPSGVTPVEPDHPLDDGEWTSNGGSSWSKAGWGSNGGAFHPIGLFLDGDVAATMAALP